MSSDTSSRSQDPQRAAALRRLHLMDTPPEEAFDRLTRLAARTLGVPVALVNLIDDTRQFFKSAVGMAPGRELPIETGVCSYAVTSRQALVIEDARVDPKFAANPIVTEIGLVAYIGIPLITSQGHALGTFCVVDSRPRRWSDAEVETIRDLAASVMTEVELRLTAIGLEHEAEEAQTARAAADAAHRGVQDLVEGLDAIVWEADASTWHFSFVSRRAEEILGHPVRCWLDDPEFWRSLVHPDDQERVVRLCTRAIAEGRDHSVEYRAIAADGRTVWLRDAVRVLCGPDGRPQRLRGVMTDVTARAEAEAALAESEARYRSLADDALGTSEVGTFVLDANFQVAWANEAIKRFFALDRRGTVGADKRRLLRERIAPLIEDGDSFAERVLGTYSDNSGVAEFECKVLAGEGRPERWLAHWSRPIACGLYAGGRIEHYYDITERKQAEAHRARLAAIVHSAYDAIMGLGLDGTIESWNPAAEEMFGYRAGEAVGRPVALLLPPGREAELAINLETVLRGKRIRQFETVRRHRDGRLLDVSITSSPIYDGSGRLVGISSILRDVSERNRAHERIRFQAKLLNAVGQAVIATDPQGRITFWNRAAETLYGWREEEVIGQSVVDVTPAEMAREQAAELMARLTAGESWSGEFMVRRRDGSSFLAMVHDTPVVDDRGDLSGIIGVSWDVTDWKRTEEALRFAKEEAERANRSKTEFLSSMSHELRTPLNAIAGYVDLIDLGVHGPIGEAQREALGRIRRNQEHLLALINDVLHFAKIGAGRLEYRIEEVPLHDILADLEILIAPQAAGRGIAFSCTRPDADWFAACDADRVQQVLLNLVGNAIKFTEPGGWVMLSCVADDERIRVRVADNGRGIPPDRLESIFDPFVQIDRHRNERSQQGVGLGLAISRELARGMGGDLTVTSTLGEGSVFTLHLPRVVGDGRG